MARDSAFVRLMKSNYALLGLDVQNVYQKTKMVLKLFRRMRRLVSENFDEMSEEAFEDCLDAEQQFIYLVEFNPTDLNYLTYRVEQLTQERYLLNMIEKAAVRMKNYDNGELYYQIIEMKYLDFFTYSEDEILEHLALERSTFYRKKNEAIYLLGMILFGLFLREFRQLK